MIRKSKLFQVLSTFDKYELNRCRKFLCSPYFNSSEQLVQLFDLLTRVNKKENKATLDNEYLWQQLNPDKPYNDVRFRKYASDLLKLVEQYMVQEAFRQDPVTYTKLLVESINERKMSYLTKSAIKKARRYSQQRPFHNSDYYLDQYRIEKNFYDLSGFETKRASKTNEASIIQNLDYFYIIEKLRLTSSVLSRQQIISHEYQQPFETEIINYIKEQQLDDIPAISVYYHIYQTLTDADTDEHYFSLKELLSQHSGQFPPKEAYSLYSFARNYCVRKVNQGHQSFLHELFLLYNDLIEKHLILTDGNISPWDFKNITQCALRLREFSWAENFILEYQDKLPEDFRDNAVTYNLAQLYFYEKKYLDVIEKLRDVEFEDFSYNLNSKTMLLATYYELDEMEPLFSIFESFRAFLNRHKDFPVSRRQLYLNLIKYTKKISRLNPGDQKGVQKLKDEIENNKNIASYNWLQEKIMELEGA